MTELTEEQKACRERWCQELESGKWRQGKGQLESGDGHCCFGVLAKIEGKFIKTSSLRFERIRLG